MQEIGLPQVACVNLKKKKKQQQPTTVVSR